MLVALPSGWRASRSGPPAATQPAIVGSSSDEIDLVPFVSLAAAVVALAVLVGPDTTASLVGRPLRPASVTPGTETVRMGGATTQRTALSVYWGLGPTG